MSRYRLRFLLQELDLQGSDVVIGRSPECQITIEDPLVSRKHARITIDEQGATVVDLGSRNGVRINGSLIRGPSRLKHNDRLRLGTQDLVFLVIDEGSSRLPRATGFMAQCHACGRPFPGESAACPHCGTEVRGEAEAPAFDTITGVAVENQLSWAFQLLGEVIERALSQGRSQDAERMMERAAREVEERTRLGQRLDADHLKLVAVYALRLARLRNEARWAEWALSLHRDHGTLPSSDVLDHLEALSPAVVEALQPILSGFFLWWSASKAESANDDELGLGTRVRALARQA